MCQRRQRASVQESDRRPAPPDLVKFLKLEQHCRFGGVLVWSAPAERSGDGALDAGWH
jgi:hypothetical protein